MRYLVTILMVLSLATAKGQEPAILSLQGFAGDKSDNVAHIKGTADGGFVVTISSSSSNGTGNIDSFCTQSGMRTIFRKYNANGTIVEWDKCYNYQDGDSFLYYIYPQTDGGFVLGGSFKAFMGRGFLITKHDASGNVLWQRDYCKGSDPILKDMIATSDGGFIMTADISYSDTTATIHYGNNLVPDVAVLKLDSLGNKQWCRVLGGTGYDYPGNLVEAPGGGVYVVGRSTSQDNDCASNHGSQDVFVARLDAYGNTVWAKCFGGSLDEGGQNACADGQYGVLIAGYANSNNGDVNGHINGRNSWVLDVDSTGGISWNNCYGGGGFEYANAISRTANGKIWLASNITVQGGQIDTIYSNADVWFSYLDNNGDLLTSKVIGGTGQDIVNAIYSLPGDICIAGGGYRKNDISFESVSSGGPSFLDAYLLGLAPWSTGFSSFVSKNISIDIYPNPANSSINIDLKTDKKIHSTIRIKNITGQMVHQQNGNGNAVIAVGEWPRGIYFVEVILSGNGKVVKTILLQ